MFFIILTLLGLNILIGRTLSLEHVKEIEDATVKFSQLFSQKKWEALGHFYTEHSLVMVPNLPPVRGKDGAINLLIELQQSLNFDKVVLETIETSALSNNLIFERGRQTFYSKDGDVLDEGKYVVIWKKVLNEWKIYVDTPSSNIEDKSKLVMSENDMVEFIGDTYKKWVQPINVNYLEEIIAEDFYAIWNDGTKFDREQYIQKYQQLQNEKKRYKSHIGEIHKVNGNTAIYHRELELFTLNGQSIEKQNNYVAMTFDLAQQKLRKIQLFDTKEDVMAHLQKYGFPQVKEEL